MNISDTVDGISVRTIQESDFKDITILSNQLGYKIESEVVKEQMKSIISSSDHLAFVAISNETIVGFIHGFYALRLTSMPFFEICALIVIKNHRNRGIGKYLVKYLEQNISQSGSIRVRCNTKRISAHSFYDKLSYSEKKEQKIFQKSINL